MSWDFRELVVDGPSDQKHYSLSGEIIILHVAEMRSALLEVIVPEQQLEIDLSSVTEIDGAGVQLLLFAKQEAKRRASELIFSRHSEPVLELIDLFNLGQDFGDPVLITAEAQSL